MTFSLDETDQEIAISFGATLAGAFVGTLPMAVFFTRIPAPDSPWVYASIGCCLMIFIIAGGFAGAYLSSEIITKLNRKKQLAGTVTHQKTPDIPRNLRRLSSKQHNQTGNTMSMTYCSSYIQTEDVNLAWAAFQSRMEVTGHTGKDTLYTKQRFVVDDERLLSPDEALAGGDFDVEYHLEPGHEATAHRVIDNDGQTVGWLFAGLVGQ